MLRITRRRTRRRTRRGPGAGARTWRGLVWTPAPDPAEVRPRLSPASWTRARRCHRDLSTAAAVSPPAALQHSAASAGETETQTQIRGYARTLQTSDLGLTGQWISAHFGQPGHGERGPRSFHYPSHSAMGRSYVGYSTRWLMRCSVEEAVPSSE